MAAPSGDIQAAKAQLKMVSIVLPPIGSYIRGLMSVAEMLIDEEVVPPEAGRPLTPRTVSECLSLKARHSYGSTAATVPRSQAAGR